MREVQPLGRVGPANAVTLARAGLVVVVAVLVVLDLAGHGQRLVLAGVAAVALALDAVDGYVARRTGTVTAFGARFDMETDAALILVLSVDVAPRLGWWVLLAGTARYLLGAAAYGVPWLRAPTPPRYWAKVVAAVLGIVLAVAASDLLPRPVARGALLVALVLLAESFGRQVLWLWRHRPQPDRDSWGVTVAAAVLAWVALVLPPHPTQLAPEALLRAPVELAVLLAAAALLPRLSRPLALLAGVLLGLTLLVKVLDLGFETVFARPVDPLNDWRYLGPGLGVLRDQSGLTAAVLAVVGAVLLVALALVGCPLALVRVARVAGRHRLPAAGLAALVGVLQLVPVLTSASAASVAYGEVAQLHHDIGDRKVFAREIAHDPESGVAARSLVGGLAGKDVLVVFVESYGRVAVEGSSYSGAVDRELDTGTQELQRAGFTARTAYLRSPTFGAGSWLAHSTLQSGLWVDTEQRYDQLLQHHRLTLSRAFREAGWRTVLDEPADTRTWTQGMRFYDVEKDYDAHDVGYRGPSFSYATMPDEYTLAAFARHELTPGRSRPVMAEIDLVSSHHPWTPLPRMVPWSAIGDGSVFDPMPAEGETPDQAFRHPAEVRALYGESIVYAWQALVAFLQHVDDPNLVLVVLGDHQPHTYVSGAHPGHDVPVSVIAHDPSVLDRISGWGWQPGLRPHDGAPVLRMDRFRDSFFSAFGS